MILLPGIYRCDPCLGQFATDQIAGVESTIDVSATAFEPDYRRQAGLSFQYLQTAVRQFN